MPKTIIENANGPVSSTNPLPVTVSGGGGGGDASAANQTTMITEIGATNETSAAADNTTSGLNGLTKRLLARITVFIGLFPTSLGQKAKTTSLAVALASDDDLIAVTGTTADAVVAAGAVGTVSAKLRRLTTDVAALLTGIVLAAGTNRIGTVGSDDKFITVTPTLDTAIYAAGDDLFNATQIAGVNVSSGRTVMLMSITVVDKDDQGQPFDLIFFDQTVTFGTLNAAPSISDADAVLSMGHVSIGTNDYKDLGGARVACVRGIGLEMKPNTTDLYVCGLSQGAGTYTASGLVLKFGFLVS